MKIDTKKHKIQMTVEVSFDEVFEMLRGYLPENIRQQVILCLQDWHKFAQRDEENNNGTTM